MSHPGKSAADSLTPTKPLPIQVLLGAWIRDLQLYKLVSIAFQLGLLLWVVDLYAIEERSGLSRDFMYLIFGGFLFHALLPMRWRLPFFFALTVASMVLVFQPLQAALLTSMALGLIGICHLPVHRWLRLSLLIAAGIALASVRAGWIETSWSTAMITVLGSMFMFRLAIYLYDVRNEKTKASLWERLCYFFMLPNVLFPFFPIVDYLTFRKTYYNSEPYTIYQKGILWMLRGMIHLLLYRLVYYHLSPAVEDIRDIGGVVLFITSSYLLYLRISGLFHFIIGLMCMFGFNLPETHRHYFLASGFNDFWRRINIYWKDFMMKLFFYPVYMKVRHWGATTALVFSTMTVFIATWLLHSYQVFWLHGHFPVTMADGVFWGVLGVLVVINSVWETKRGTTKRLSVSGSKNWSTRKAVWRAFQIIGTGLFLSLMWSFWSSTSTAEWWSILAQSGQGTPQTYFLLFVGMVMLLLFVIWWQYAEHKGRGLYFNEIQAPPARTALVAGTGLLLLFGLGQPGVLSIIGERPAAFIASLKTDRMSIKEDRIQERGYYERLLNPRATMTSLWEKGDKRPADWQGLVPSGVARETNDLLDEVLYPSITTVFKRAPLSTNDWGMRDQSYLKEKPPQTLRIALLGKSYEMGWGVKNSHVFEQIAEDTLNLAGHPDLSYEILNFSVGGYALLQYIALSEQKVPSFRPDAVLVTAHAGEGSRLVTNILKLYNKDIPLPESIQEYIERAGITPLMAHSEQKRRLLTYEDTLVRWSYDTLIEGYVSQEITPIWLFVPRTLGHLRRVDGFSENETEFARWSTIAQTAGFEHVWSLAGAFDAYEDERTLRVAEWDTHPNVEGHRLLGNRLYQKIMEHHDDLVCGAANLLCPTEN